jgi:hypothetical protein
MPPTFRPCKRHAKTETRPAPPSKATEAAKAKAIAVPGIGGGAEMWQAVGNKPLIEVQVA